MNNRLVVIWENDTPDNEVLTFTDLTDVQNHYGVVSNEFGIAEKFFASNPTGTLSFTREGLGQRPHLIGANLSGDNLSQLQAINGPFSVVFNGNTYGSSVNLAGATSFAQAATLITAALNYHLPVVATTTGSTITPETTNFTGNFSRAQLTVDFVQPGKLFKLVV